MNTQTTFDIREVAKQIEEHIRNTPAVGRPQSLYEPINYIMSLGGKRMRPLLVSMGCYLFDDRYEKSFDAALAVEVFHNFTLMHDDIMDKAPLRRGMATVHEKWDTNVAILSGDVMLVQAYKLLVKLPVGLLPTVLRLFNRCAEQVCEGQQIDMDFENENHVEASRYIEMISLKTAVLLGFALELGALIGGASETEARVLREYGILLGTGFQLKDDILDVYGDKETFGKQVGGDIIANKKTLLLIKALEMAKGDTLTELQAWLHKKDFDKEEKVASVTAIYNELGIRELAEGHMNDYFQKAFAMLGQINTPLHKKQALIDFSQGIIDRIK